ncbi:hypothetical protein [Streptomyces koyangensis]
MSDGTLLGAASIVVGGIASVVVAWISRPRAAPTDADPPDGDLSTVAGIATVVAQQQQSIVRLEAAQARQREHSAAQDRTITALRRYVLALQGALRRSGTPIPEPEPEDADLIRG